MMPGDHDVSYYRGSTEIVGSVQWTENDVAVNLTGFTATLTIRDTNGTVVASTSSGITATITAATGTTTFAITQAAAAAIPIGVHKYDVWLISGGNVHTALLTGTFVCVEEVRS